MTHSRLDSGIFLSFVLYSKIGMHKNVYVNSEGLGCDLNALHQGVLGSQHHLVSFYFLQPYQCSNCYLNGIAGDSRRLTQVITLMKHSILYSCLVSTLLHSL